MANNKPDFPTLVDENGEGITLDRVVNEVTNPTLLNGSIGFAFRNSSGEVVLPQLTADGKLPVDTEASNGLCKRDQGAVDAGSAENTLVTLAEITVTANATAEHIQMTCGGRRGGYFQLQYVDDADGTPVIEILEEVYLDSGQYTFCLEDDDCRKKDTTGGTGTQKIRVQAYNWGSGSGQLSRLSASVSLEEI